MCVCMYVFVYVCIYLSIYLSPLCVCYVMYVMLCYVYVSGPEVIILCLLQSHSLHQELTDLSRLADQSSPGVLLFLPHCQY